MVKDPGGRQRSSWRPHRACLEAIPADATHALIVQDDAWPCDSFAEAVTEAIAERSDRIICLFVPGVGPLARRVALARKRRERWLEFPSITFVPTVAIIYPAEIAREIGPFADAKRVPVGRADDAVVSMFARAHHLQAIATLPSLVQHLDGVPSVMLMPSGHGHSHRLAAWFEEAPPKDVLPLRASSPTP